MSDFDDLNEILETMKPLMERMKQRAIDREITNRNGKTDVIADQAWIGWSKDDLRFFLCESPVWLEFQEMKQKDPALYYRLSSLSRPGRFNGYVRFPKLPMVAPGLRGILDYIPVHGGLTFFQEWWDGSVTYGFDTGHLVSMEMKEIINDVEWMMAETESMGRSIQIASRFERYYLNAGEDNDKKARVLDRMGKFLPVNVRDNLGIMLNLLCGDL
jgi:hypothetical protein